MTQYDAVILGAGIIGVATAYHLKLKDPSMNVLVVDKRPAVAQGSTAKSAAAFRTIFASKTNMDLAVPSVDFYEYVHNNLRDLGLKWTGYLWLVDDKRFVELNPVLEKMKQNKLEIRLFELDDLAKMLNIKTTVSQDEEAKMMGLPDIHKGIFVPRAGVIDVDSLVDFYKRGFEELGGKIQVNTTVNRILVEPKKPLGISGEPYFWQEAEVTGVETNRGIIKAKKTIVAAGPWEQSLIDPLGIDCFIKSKKRQVFSMKASDEELKNLLYTKGFNNVDCVKDGVSQKGCLPFTILPKPRVYIRPVLEENALWLAYADDFPRGFTLEEEPEPEENYFNFGIYQVVNKYFPQFINKRPFSAFAGQYEINTIDGKPLIFDEHGLMVVGGASGSGILKGDSIARIATALYFGQEYAELYGGKKFKVSDLGLKERHTEPELMVI